MKRKIDDFLLHWKNDENRKPLIIYGSKGVGKTYSSILFGIDNYKDIVYIDCEDEENVLKYLKKENNYEGFIKSLEEYSKKKITQNDTLLIMDNVNSEEIVNYFRSFGKFKTEYHIILISSSKNNINKFKGIEFQFKSMFPMDFEEFLRAQGKDELVDFIKVSFKNNTKNPFHTISMEYFEKYIETGGMPEAVDTFLKTNDLNQVRAVLNDILEGYKDDYGKHLNENEEEELDRALLAKINKVYASIPAQLAKENKKFMYSKVAKKATSTIYDPAIQWLVDYGLVTYCYNLRQLELPLSGNKIEDCFKLYVADTGLFMAMLEKDVYEDVLFGKLGSYKGAL